MPLNKRWTILNANEGDIDNLQSELKINRSICKILVERNIKSFSEAKDFFRPQLSHLHDPYLMKDMDKAVTRICNAFSKNEKILIYGDYDVDGTTSVAMMFHFIRKIYDEAKLDFYIPHRYREGYGISKEGIDYANNNGFNLIISLDCGIKSIDLIQYALELGIDFIVCDHHLPEKDLPPAVAILNAKQIDCKYPYKELCGCGVGFKLITALSQKLKNNRDEYFCYLDLVATAIAADIVPLTGENRILAYFGLKKINENPNIGLKALLEVGGINTSVNLSNVCFVIAPRINAAGRMDDAKKAVQLFIEEDETEAFKFASMLQSDNKDRKETDSSITVEAIEMVRNEESNKGSKNTTVVFKPTWHKGVVGIVASRLIENFYRPTVVLTQSGEVVAGSARSVSGFNLYEAIHACREHLLGYGGHFAAAGMTMLPESVIHFKEKFEKVVSTSISPELLIPEIIIDAEISFNSITLSYFNIIKQMEPFGPDNCKPVFLTRNVVNTGYSKILKDQHIRFSLRENGTTVTGIGFNMADKFSLIENKPFDILYTLDENAWNNETRIQLKVIDIMKTSANPIN
ncbi:MAG: single-stranded-DNA-specific exonuclease RecJ [Ginsengibacter sp.]